MKRFRKHWWGILYSILLVGFTVYVALDTFVITRVYGTVPQEGSQAEGTAQDPGGSAGSGSQGEGTAQDPGGSAGSGSQGEGTAQDSGGSAGSGSQGAASGEPGAGISVSENAYSDENISISITEYREEDTSIYVADIALSSPEYLRTAFAGNVYGRNVKEKTSEIAEGVGAVLAINGDYYGAQERGYVIRNGILYRSTSSGSTSSVLAIYEDGSFGFATEGDVSAEGLLEAGAVQVLSFGPELIVDGNVSVTEGEEVGKAKASNPRTAIGIVGDLHYVFVVADGRTDESEGLSLRQLAEFMAGLGVTDAYNLDGGGSSTMYFNGRVVNNPTSDGRRIKERSVSDIVYIGY